MVIETPNHSRELIAADIRSREFATSICSDEVCALPAQLPYTTAIS
jgi:hypothetical protein